MAVAVIMPRQGQSVESCVISEWFKAVGDSVAEGEPLFSYETDKAAFEEPAKATGTLLAVFFGAGDDVPCLTSVAVIGAAGEDISAFKPETAPVEREPEKEVKRVMTVAAASAAAAVGVSPRARETARRMGVDPSKLTPSGPHGRVIERDVFANIQAEAPVAASGYEDRKLSNMRKLIGKTMWESLSQMAQLTHFSTFDATRLFAVREALKAKGVKVSVTDIVVFAASRVLKKHPALNAHLMGDTIRLFDSVNMGLAVDTERGLIVPTIFGADTLGIAELAAESRRLADMARGGSIPPDLLTGGTFTVSSLGSLKVEQFTPIINPPQTGILGLCAAVDRPRLTPHGIELYPAMGLALTYDHRALDGAPAQRFLVDLIEYLENIKESDL